MFTRKAGGWIKSKYPHIKQPYEKVLLVAHNFLYQCRHHHHHMNHNSCKSCLLQQFPLESIFYRSRFPMHIFENQVRTGNAQEPTNYRNHKNHWNTINVKPKVTIIEQQPYISYHNVVIWKPLCARNSFSKVSMKFFENHIEVPYYAVIKRIGN